jgi:hypothetical protein
MANSRIMLTCKHCGEQMCLGSGYHGEYSTINKNLSEELNRFYHRHKEGICSEEICCSDNARDHFEIQEFFENPEDYMSVEELLKAIIHRYGKEKQMIVAIEELSELQKELTKNLRGKDNLDALAEEIADVEIMLAQLRIIFPDIHERVDRWKVFKLNAIEALCVDGIEAYVKARDGGRG